MRIAVNTRLLLSDRLEGIGRFTDEILKRLVRIMPETEFTFLFDRQYDPAFIYAPNVTAKVLQPQARHPILYQLWFERSTPRFLKNNPHDIYLSTDGYIPIRAAIKKVNVMHDINFEHFPELMSGMQLWHFKKYFPRYARFSDKLLTVSEFSRFDIASTYQLDEENIDVLYNGVSDSFSPIVEDEKKLARNRWSAGKKYFIHIGAMNPRKNLPFLLRAFETFSNSYKEDVRLLIVGSEKGADPAIERTLKEMVNASKVKFTGRLSDDDLQLALGSAEALTFVPIFEGFGIPIVEAFACGVPVIISNVSALPEVAQESALYIDPENESSLVGAMKEVLAEENLRKRLVLSGLKRKEEFSWERSAQKLANHILECHGRA